MGTRADFYIGRGEKAEWIGSVAMDGYPEGVCLTLPEKEVILETRLQRIEINKHAEFPAGEHVFDAQAEDVYRARVATYFQNRDDVTLPEQGWPWPWETSATTDYAYAFDDGKVYASCFGGPWWIASEEQPGDEEDDSRTAGQPKAVFPDMSAKTNVAMGKRSGLLVFTSKA